MENKTAVWVNAKNPLPNMEEVLFIKDNAGRKLVGHFFTDNGVVKLNIDGNDMHGEFIVENEHLDHYWWLDENQPVGKTLYLPVENIEMFPYHHVNATLHFNSEGELMEFDSEEDAIEELERNNVTNYKIYSRKEK